MPGNVPVISRAEVEVEGEGEGTKITPPQENDATASQATRTPPPRDRNREHSFKLIKEKLQTRAAPDPDSILMECLDEDPERDAWFELSPPHVRDLIAKATAAYRKGEVKFKTELIVLLDRATLDKRKERRQQNPKPSMFDSVVAEFEAKHGRKPEM